MASKLKSASRTAAKFSVSDWDLKMSTPMLVAHVSISLSERPKLCPIVYNKPYDTNIFDWMQALIGIDISPQKTNRFWCSALIGYIYTKLGILKHNTDWSILTPNDFSLSGENLTINKPYSLSNELIKIK